MPIKESSEKSNEAPVPTLILMRHGIRSFDGDALSNEGKQQAANLATDLKRILLAKGLPLPDRLESSPKKRTQATLAPLARDLGLRVIIESRLDERIGGETEIAFERRVKAALADCDEWAASEARAAKGAVRLFCSHLDWLEAAALFIASDEGDFERSEPWPPLTIRVYTYVEGIWKRQNL